MSGQPCTAHLRNTQTGETGEHRTTWDDEGGWSLWAEGNFSCDCNRWLFLYGSERVNEQPCSDGLIAVDRIVLNTGRVVYSDHEATRALLL